LISAARLLARENERRVEVGSCLAIPAKRRLDVLLPSPEGPAQPRLSGVRADSPVVGHVAQGERAREARAPRDAIIPVSALAQALIRSALVHVCAGVARGVDER